MPARCVTAPHLNDLIESQDWIIHRDQAIAAGLNRRAVEYRLSSHQWHAVLPKIYLTHPGEPNRRQMLISALLYAGPDSAIDADDACRWHGIKAVQVDDNVVHVVEPWGAPARSRGFVVVRRTVAPINIVRSQRLRYVEPAAAVIAAARLVRGDRLATAILSDAIQRRVTTYDDLVRAHIQATPRNATPTDRALTFLSSGAHSVAEATFLQLAAASMILPEPTSNAILLLPDGRVVSPDALFVEAGLVHETNGRVAHQRDDLFEDMQERHDAMTTAGLIVLHNSPRRLAQHGRAVINQVERCYLSNAGRGLPPGVSLRTRFGRLNTL